MNEEYTSQEMAEMGHSAPTNTIEEDIDKMCEEQVTISQLDFRKKVNKVESPEVMELYFDTYPKAGSELYHQEVEQAIDKLRGSTKQEIGALHVLRDYRLANYAEHKTRNLP